MSLLKLAKQQKRGIIDSITFQSCEYYLLELILADLNHNKNETINFEKYI